MNPWVLPIFDAIIEWSSIDYLEKLISNKKIEIVPLAFMRGRTFSRAFIIADEMQNASPKQMQMAVTRVGKESRMVVTGASSCSFLLLC